MPCGVSRALRVGSKAIPVSGGVPARTDSLRLVHGPGNTSPTTSSETVVYGGSHSDN